MKKSVIIIGGGISGMTAAGTLTANGVNVILLEKNGLPGGHVADWHRLFPDQRKASEITGFGRHETDGIGMYTGNSVSSIIRSGETFKVTTDMDKTFMADALLIATGFDLFDARKKEEYGYGIYNNVITSAELEQIFNKGEGLRTAEGKPPGRIGFIHCVGSRDEKVGNLYCSKVCCITGVKQAIEIKELLPSSEVYCFYMDLRMYDRHFEELYYEAQQKWGINFIRGRLSECSENQDGSIVVKTEDTLSGRPLKMNVDLMVLLVGMVPSGGTGRIAAMLGLKTGDDGFISSADLHLRNNSTEIPGVFIAGAVKGPVSVNASIADARAAAVQVLGYLNSRKPQHA